MTGSLRASKLRLVAAAILVMAGGVIALFVLPDASQQQRQKEKALALAAQSSQSQMADLKQAQAEAERIQAGQRALDQLLRAMPSEGLGQLQWKLSQSLYGLSQKHQVRLIAVKYGPPTHEGARGVPLESVDVEFNVTGIYQHLKSFMLALEGSRLPFAVVGAKMEETAEGAHLTITLRAFRQAPAGESPTQAEGA